MVDAGDRIRKRVQQALAQEKQSNVYSPYSGQTFTPNFTPGENSVVKQSPYACTNACADSPVPGALFFSASTPSFVQVTNKSSLTIGTSDFTIEWWQYLNPPVPTNGAFQPCVFGFAPSLTQDSSIMACWSLTGPTYTTYELTIAVGASSQTYSSVATVPTLLNTWIHVAIVGTGGTDIKVYLNGQESSTVAPFAYNITNSLVTYPSFGIGGTDPYSNEFRFTGFITDFRFTIGTALYTAAFTPPKQPLPIVPGTVLLLNALANAPLKDSSTYTQTVTSGTTTVGWDNVSPYYPVND